MIPGIDPKVDIAFKKVFGSESWTDLTASLINAVLEPPRSSGWWKWSCSIRTARR